MSIYATSHFSTLAICQMHPEVSKRKMNEDLLLQPSESFTIQAYTDVDWGAQPDDRRSSSGYLLYLGNNLVS